MADSLVPKVDRCLRKGKKAWKAKRAQEKEEDADDWLDQAGAEFGIPLTGNDAPDKSDQSEEDGEVSDDEAEDKLGSNPPVEDGGEDENEPAAPGTYSPGADEDPLDGTPNGPEPMGSPGIASSVADSLSHLHC